jgi:hypothetical protein
MDQLGRLPLRVFSIGKYALQKKRATVALAPHAVHKTAEAQLRSSEKKTCLEMGVAGEADARLAFGRSARLGRLLVARVVNHRVLPSAPMVGRVSGSSSARTRV